MSGGTSAGNTAATSGPALDERLVEVRDRIAATGRDPDEVRVVAVTKGFPLDVAAGALSAGLLDLGENFPQELLDKAAALAPLRPHGAPRIRWHLIGPPQRNKMARIAGVVELWQAVDRPEVVDRLGRVAPGARLLVQVNVGGIEGKAGCAPSDVEELVKRSASRGLHVDGLMCVGPAQQPDGTQRAFRTVAAMAADLGLPEVSMGMSDDFETAVACGSTMVRLGRMLFGPRPGRTTVRR